MGKKLRAKQNRDGSPRFFEATKKIDPLEKNKRGLKTQMCFELKFVFVKNAQHLKIFFSCQ